MSIARSTEDGLMEKTGREVYWFPKLSKQIATNLVT